ncbi:unnamed protein product [Rotaria socialis]
MKTNRDWLEQRHSLAISENTQHQNSNERTKNKGSQELSIDLLCGLIIGALVGGISLAIVITFYLQASATTIQTITTSTSTTATSATPQTTTTTTTTATTTTTTVTTTTTTTTVTTTTTTATTASTIPAPLAVCPTSNDTANSYLSPGALLFSTYTVNIACTSYIRVAWLYTAQSASETITIDTYNVPATTYIDDVSVIDMNTSQELLTNGGFESGAVIWIGSATNDITSGGSSCYGGSWCYSDAAITPHGNISQSFSTTAGHTLSISFYISWSGTGVVYNCIGITP